LPNEELQDDEAPEPLVELKKLFKQRKKHAAHRETKQGSGAERETTRFLGV
jgi:hypothetical protein